MRPPIDPARTYTLLTDIAARRRLATEFGMSRVQTADMTLDQLHDALSERLQEGFGVHLLIMKERSFSKVSARSDELLRELHGGQIEQGASMSSMTAARRMIEDAGVDIPDDADRDGLEDVLSALKGTRYMILEDEAFTTYGREMSGVLGKQPSGRSQQ